MTSDWTTQKRDENGRFLPVELAEEQMQREGDEIEADIERDRTHEHPRMDELVEGCVACATGPA